MGLYFVVRSGLLCTLLSIINICSAQDSTGLDRAFSFPDKAFSLLSKKTSQVESKLDGSTAKYLFKLQKQENKLRKKLSKVDSLRAHQLFDGMEEKYSSLKSSAGKFSKYESVYSGHLDSLSTALSFLKNNNLSSFASNAELQKALDQYKGLQDKLNASEQIQKYLIQRQLLLKQQLESLGMIKELKQFQKQVFYYKEQVAQYKQAFEDPTKLEQKLLDVVMKVPQFKDFFAKNSMLGSLFALPGSGNASAASLQGLQTRTMINQSLVDRLGTGADVTQQLQQNLQDAQGQLNNLKGKLNQYTSSNYGNSSTDPSMPDFRKNEMKTKSLAQRLEWGSNVQTQKARYFFPTISDIGVSLGYRLRQNWVVGAGGSLKIGLGQGWDHIAITYQGVSARSYIDFKLKGSLWLAGAFEMNYMKLITSTAQLKEYSAWQKSGLIGLSKKYAISKKLKGDIKLLWDFLSYWQSPRTTNPIVFRVGYFIK